MSLAYTKEPWRIVGPHEAGYSIVSDGEILPDDHPNVAEVPLQGDARAIVAAPRMLRFLAMLLSQPMTVAEVARQAARLLAEIGVEVQS